MQFKRRTKIKRKIPPHKEFKGENTRIGFTKQIWGGNSLVWDGYKWQQINLKYDHDPFLDYGRPIQYSY